MIVRKPAVSYKKNPKFWDVYAHDVVIQNQLKIKGICILQICILFLSEMEVYK